MKTQASALVIARVPRVNLMPGAERERLAREKLARRWILVLLVTIAAALFSCAVATLLAWGAGQQLADERMRAVQLTAELENLGEVRGAIELRSELERFRTEILEANLPYLFDVGEVAVAVGR